MLDIHRIYIIAIISIILIQCINSFSINSLQKKLTTHNHANIRNNMLLASIITTDRDVEMNNVLETYAADIKSLQGTPELIDRLENLALKYPGIQNKIKLYRLLYPFKLDAFQEDGLLSLIAGNNTLVTTPTGSGKTVVGELAIYYALMVGLRVAYTTPLKALSNQKFQDFTAKFGGDRVGLLTGDIVINRGAAITVMTTEVFRNMVYDENCDQLDNLFMVCFDEFHFMNDPDRGTVWEESVISCPSNIRMLALSATMGNVVDIQGWITSIHGPTALIQSDFRPVPLRYLFAMKHKLLPLFRDPNAGPGAVDGITRVSGIVSPGGQINPGIIRLEEAMIKQTQKRMSRDGKPFKNAVSNSQSLIPSYKDVVEELHQLKLLPAIVFIFSRAGCEQSARTILQKKLNLLSEEEVVYVTQAINAFVRANPEIPLSKTDVQLFRAGVCVHHAGLIPVLKAFIEDLFNANKIKVLFATETLAAGVNMPARTTVISTVTKRINSEIVKLKTSQLLQMAGRAGRRGKDIEGTVVIMRNRFEDVKVSHKILVSPIDGIKSHFKTSYGLTVKLLETRSIDECRALIERGFGSYVLQQRSQRKEIGEKSEVDLYRNVLQKYTLKGARDYLKIVRKLEKERRNEEFLVEKMLETDSDLVQAIADYMPLGIGLQLHNDDSGFFLGELKWDSTDTATSTNDGGGFGVITSDKRFLIVTKDHIRSFSDSDSIYSISGKHAKDLIELVTYVDTWEEENITGIRRKVLVGNYDSAKAEESGMFTDAFHSIAIAGSFPTATVPGSIVRMKMIVTELMDELAASPITIAGDGELVLQSLRYAAGLKDPLGFLNGPQGAPTDGSGEAYAWKMFKNVVSVLEHFKAIESSGNSTKATEFGHMISTLSGDNELWLALVLKLDSVRNITTSAELGAVMCSIVIDGFKSSNAYFKNPPSVGVQDICMEIEKLSWEIKLIQSDMNVEFPVHLSKEAGGLVESWIRGTAWRDLCRETSLEQGDICRMLRRTVEALRQLPLAYGLDYNLSQLAYETASKMDRFPVADVDIDGAAAGSSPTSGVRSGAGVGFAVGDTVIDDSFDFVESILFDGEDDMDSAEEDYVSSNSSVLDKIDQLTDLQLDDLLSSSRSSSTSGRSGSSSSRSGSGSGGSRTSSSSSSSSSGRSGSSSISSSSGRSDSSKSGSTSGGGSNSGRIGSSAKFKKRTDK